MYPASVRCAGPSRYFTIPKSTSSGRPVPDSMRMLSGFTSRCTSPWSCACCSASRTGSTIRSARSAVSGPSVLQQIGDGAPLQVGHGVVHQALALAHEVDRNRVGMVEPGDGAGLLLEAGDGGRGPGQIGAQHLHRQAALEVGVHHLVHLGEPAAADQADHAILAAQGAAEALERARCRWDGGRARRAPRRRARGSPGRSAGSARCPRAAGRGRTSRPGPSEHLRSIHPRLGEA